MPFTRHYYERSSLNTDELVEILHMKPSITKQLLVFYTRLQLLYYCTRPELLLGDTYPAHFLLLLILRRQLQGLLNIGLLGAALLEQGRAGPQAEFRGKKGICATVLINMIQKNKP